MDLREVILFVDDMEKALDFYVGKLGLRLRNFHSVQEASKSPWVELESGTTRLDLHKSNEAPKVRKVGLVFIVPQITKSREVLVARGIEFGEIRDIAPGILECAASDPFGNQVSLIQLTALHPEGRSRSA